MANGNGNHLFWRPCLLGPSAKLNMAAKIHQICHWGSTTYKLKWIPNTGLEKAPFRSDYLWIYVSVKFQYLIFGNSQFVLVTHSNSKYLLVSGHLIKWPLTSTIQIAPLIVRHWIAIIRHFWVILRHHRIILNSAPKPKGSSRIPTILYLYITTTLVLLQKLKQFHRQSPLPRNFTGFNGWIVPAWHRSVLGV